MGIHAYAILTGYIAIRGSAFIHVPMLLVMIFMNIPTEEEFAELDGATESSIRYLTSACKTWYWYALGMHFILSVMHLAALTHALNLFASES